MKLIYGKKNEKLSPKENFSMKNLNYNSKIMLEEEFNFSKYITSNVNKVNKLSEKKLKGKINNDNFNERLKSFIHQSISKIV